MTQRHVVGDRTQLAVSRQGDVALLAGLEVAPEQQTAVALAMHLFEHLALAAAAGALVHDRDVVVVRRHHAHGRAVGRHPVFPLPQVDQHAVHALLRAGARIEVVAEQLMDLARAVVNDHLPSAEMGGPQRRRHVDHRLRRKALGQGLRIKDSLKLRQTKREEARVGRGDHHRVDPLARSARDEEEHRELLRLDPVERLLADIGERAVEVIAEPGLVAGAVVGDEHAVGVSSPHVGIRVVGRDAVADPARRGLHNASLARHIVGDLVEAIDGVANGELDQLPFVSCDTETGTRLQDFRGLERDLAVYGREHRGHGYNSSGAGLVDGRRPSGQATPQPVAITPLDGMP